MVSNDNEQAAVEKWFAQYAALETRMRSFLKKEGN